MLDCIITNGTKRAHYRFKTLAHDELKQCSLEFSWKYNAIIFILNFEIRFTKAEATAAHVIETFFKNTKDNLNKRTLPFEAFFSPQTWNGHILSRQARSILPWANRSFKQSPTRINKTSRVFYSLDTDFLRENLKTHHLPTEINRINESNQ